MTQEEKELLLKDLCARLPYNVKCKVCFQNELYTMILKTGLPNSFGNFDFENEECSLCSDDFKPYLRPISSMTEEEKRELFEIGCEGNIEHPYGLFFRCQDWLNSHHFDYRGLIEKGLALKAPERMYDTKTE